MLRKENLLYFAGITSPYFLIKVGDDSGFYAGFSPYIGSLESFNGAPVRVEAFQTFTGRLYPPDTTLYGEDISYPCTVQRTDTGKTLTFTSSTVDDTFFSHDDIDKVITVIYKAGGVKTLILRAIAALLGGLHDVCKRIITQCPRIRSWLDWYGLFARSSYWFQRITANRLEHFWKCSGNKLNKHVSTQWKAFCIQQCNTFCGLRKILSKRYRISLYCRWILSKRHLPCYFWSLAILRKRNRQRSNSILETLVSKATSQKEVAYA